MATHHPIRKTVAAVAPVIPDKLYFRIGDVARLCEVPAYVLRFWETEFPNLKPNKGGTGQRLYRRKDVETALRIKHLLYDLGYTIPGARQVFKTDAKPDAKLGPDFVSVAAAASDAPVFDSAPAKELVSLSGARSPQPKNPDASHPATTVSLLSTQALSTLRDELRALHAQLSAPVSTATAPQLIPTRLRPRLVAEPRPKPRLEVESKPKLGPIPLTTQQDLFPTE